MTDLERRDVLALMAASTVMASGVAGALAPEPRAAELPSAFAVNRQPKPLRFDPAKLNGLSEKLVRSHWENNYVGSVRTLNTIAERLAAAMQDGQYPPIAYGGLKREELHRVGSVVLHEHYFDNLGGDGKLGGSIASALKKAYGSPEAWEAEFRRTAASLAGGSGWCVLTYNLYTRELRNQWAWDHMHGAIAGMPLLVLDMYEHSYHMDYGSAAAKYIDAFMKNVNWEEVDKRFAALSNA